jgi:hypothetical protein
MNVPYFNNVNDYVNSLPYGKPLDNNGYIYESPFNCRYGERPEIVYERLFRQDHYYGLTDEELTKLRTTIQYLPVYLDDYFEKVHDFLISCGFIRYKKEGHKGALIHAYYKRNNISLYVSNQETPQDFRPNLIMFEIGKFITYNSGKKRMVSVKSMWSGDSVINEDDFGHKTKKNFEDILKYYINE